MALKMNIPLPGGIEWADGYVRVTDIRACKKDPQVNRSGDLEEQDWFLMVDVACYKDVDARGEASRLQSPHVDKFKFTFDPATDSADPATAYAKLKTLDTFTGAVDV